MEDFTLRRQPYSAEAEQAVLGSILIEPSCLNSLIGLVAPEDFYIPENGKIFEAVAAMFSSGARIDPVLLLEELKIRGLYDDAGGRAYLYKLMEATPSAANAIAYAELVKGKAKLRELSRICTESNERALAEEAEANELIESLEQRLFGLRSQRGGQGLEHIRKPLSESLHYLSSLEKSGGRLPGVPSGFSNLDYYITGLNNSDLVLLAARPGVGKTAIALNIARNAAAASNKNVAIFNLEMSRVQLVQRMLSSESMVELRKIRTATMDDGEWDRYAKASTVLSALPIYIDDTASITVAEIKARARRLSNLGLVIIDYLQLISSNRRDGNRVLEVSEISRSLKIMAKELNIPILCLSQLSRAATSRKPEDQRPRLSDLRDSGAIEQDADIVMFLYKEDKEAETVQEAMNNEITCIIAKNRNGETTDVKFNWHGQFTRFTAPDRIHDEHQR